MDAIHPSGLGGTYGGNPVACAAAVATIQTMRERDLVGAARRIESVLVPRLEELAAKHPVIGEVRGRGAMLAIELVEPGTTSPAGGPRPNAAVTQALARECHAAGLLVLTCGTFGNVLRLLPPLVIDDDTLHRGLDIIGDALAAATS
jgi:4-aminobutyrate aminotransferase/(S)-3-amino-2-methylpropionate transaminase